MATAEKVSPAVDVAAVNALLASASAEDRIAWAAREFGETLVLSSSFGAQAAVMLSLAAAVLPNIPVVLIDTGYLFPETYRFADELATRLKLNLKVYRAPLSPAWLEARHGQLWEQGLEGLTRYNQLVKVEPMQRALRELGARAWLAGLRRAQSSTREKLEVVGVQDGRVKVHPIIDWSDRDIHRYLTKTALSSFVGEGLRLDRRHAFEPPAHGRYDARTNALLWPQARVRSARRNRWHRHLGRPALDSPPSLF